MNQNINPGAVVTLKSAGPRMTVENVFEEQASCVWFENGHLFRERINVESLSAPLIYKQEHDAVSSNADRLGRLAYETACDAGLGRGSWDTIGIAHEMWIAAAAAVAADVRDEIIRLNAGERGRVPCSLAGFEEYVVSRERLGKMYAEIKSERDELATLLRKSSDRASKNDHC
jgi:uncharacterized protein YodC (DUF2158 family)